MFVSILFLLISPHWATLRIVSLHIEFKRRQFSWRAPNFLHAWPHQISKAYNWHYDMVDRPWCYWAQWLTLRSTSLHCMPSITDQILLVLRELPLKNGRNNLNGEKRLKANVYQNGKRPELAELESSYLLIDMLQTLLSQHDRPLFPFVHRLFGDIWQRNGNLQRFSNARILFLHRCLCSNDFLRLNTRSIDYPYFASQSGIVQTFLQHNRVRDLICTVNQSLDHFTIGYKGQLQNRVGGVGITEWNPVWIFVHHENSVSSSPVLGQTNKVSNWVVWL